MVSDAFLAIVAVCGVFLCRAMLREQSELSASRRRLHFALLWGGRAERHLLFRPAVCFSLVGLMALIDIIIVVHKYVRLYRYVPHRRIRPRRYRPRFGHRWGTLRRPLAPQRGIA